MLTGKSRYPFAKSKLREGRLAGQKLLEIDQGHHAFDLRGAEVEEQLLAPGHRRVDSREKRQLDVQHPGRRQLLVPGEHHPAGDRIGFHPAQVDRRSLTRDHLRDRLAVHLDSPHPKRPGQSGKKRDRLLGDDLAGEKGAGGHRPKPLDRKGSIDGEKKGAFPGTLGKLASQIAQHFLERVDSLAGFRGTGNHLRLLQKRALGERFQIRPQKLQPLLAQLAQQIRLGDRDHPGAHPEQPADVEVLASLGHYPFVRGDDEDR